MFCSNCGVQVDDVGKFCTQCGTRIHMDVEISETVNPNNNVNLDKTVDIDETQKLQQSEYKEIVYNCQDAENKINYVAKDSLVPLIVILCVVAVGSIGAISYMLNKTYIKPVTTYSNIGEKAKLDETVKMQKSVETKNSTVTTSTKDSSNMQLDNENVIEPTYLTHNDSLFKLSCAYPSHFVKTENVKEEDRLLLEAPNKTAKMSICAIRNNSTNSAKEVMQQHINSMGGNVEYKANGDTWYATSITVGDMWYYRKCFVHNDYISWFDFYYPVRYNDMYQNYINYIEDNFKAQQSN